MRKRAFLAFALALSLGLAPAHGQFGGRGGLFGGGPKLSTSITKLFGDNPTFTADLDVEMETPSGEKISTPATMVFDHGKTRFEMDLGQVQGGNLPPNTKERMKAMGMDKMVVISRPDKKQNYLVYPGLSAYAAVDQDDSMTSANGEEFKVDLTEQGSESVNGRQAVKYNAAITLPDGRKQQATVWKAKSLKNFPVKIFQRENDTPITMTFTQVDFSKPEAKSFDPPSKYAKYDNVQTMMQEEMLKKAGAGRSAPSQPPPPQ